MKELLKAYITSTGSAQNAAADKLIAQPDAIAFLYASLTGDNRRSAAALLIRAARKQALQTAISDLEKQQRVLHSLLKDPDAKTRKNAAILLGQLGDRGCIPDLLSALQQETQLFVRPSLILALGSLGGKAAHDAIVALPLPTGTDTHAVAERDAITKALSRLAPMTRRTFTGFDRPLPVHLINVAGLYPQLEQEAREHGMTLKHQRMGGSIVTQDYASLFQLNSFYEALLPVGGPVPFTPEGVAQELLQKHVFQGLSRMHAGNGPFMLRLELRSKTPVNRAAFASRFFSLLDATQFVNAPSSYDVELRVQHVPDGAMLFIKLHTFDDLRFSYRLETVPASIHPAAAAAVLRLVRSRMRPNATVLDPFCGAGTLLAERTKILPVKALHGVDISREACSIAQDNLHAAGQRPKIFNRNILGFHQEHPYQEIYCNMPFGNRVGTHASNETLYQAFFAQLPTWLDKTGFALCITNEKRLLLQCVKAVSSLALIQETPFSAGGLSPSAFLLERR